MRSKHATHADPPLLPFVTILYYECANDAELVTYSKKCQQSALKLYHVKRQTTPLDNLGPFVPLAKMSLSLNM